MTKEDELIDTGTTSLFVTESDVNVFEKYGMRTRPVGKVYHQAVREMDSYRVLGEELRTALDRFDEGDLALGKFLQRLRELAPDAEELD